MLTRLSGGHVVDPANGHDGPADGGVIGDSDFGVTLPTKISPGLTSAGLVSAGVTTGGAVFCAICSSVSFLAAVCRSESIEPVTSGKLNMSRAHEVFGC